jgi:hypothetical protein
VWGHGTEANNGSPGHAMPVQRINGRRSFLNALRVPLSGGRPFFLKPKRQTRAAMWTLKTPTKLSMCTILGADHFGAYQHWDTAIISYGGRIFLREDIKERFHATHTGITGRVINARRIALFLG